MSLLLVDDYRPGLALIEAILAPLGHRVVFAESAAAALRLLATEEFAAILSDVRMPGMDGVEMLARLRAEGLAPLTPILLLSAERDPDAERQAYLLGAIGYIVKPFDPELLRCRVQGAVTLYRQQREGRAQLPDVAAANGRADGDGGAGAAAVAREAERLISRKDTFLAILGHDLRNPLAAAFAGLRLLAGATDLPDRLRPTLARVIRSSDRMNRMIGDILDFARASAGEQFPFRARSIDLRDVIIAVVDEVREVTPDRPIELFVPESLNTECDPDRIGQALGNLVRNAVQHGVEGVAVSASFDEGDVVIGVLSVGPAIPDSVRTTLFDPFTHGASHHGLGLGLYIVNEVVRAHGGAVTVHSSDLGNRFEMRWPRLQTPRRDGHEGPHPHSVPL